MANQLNPLGVRISIWVCLPRFFHVGSPVVTLFDSDSVGFFVFFVIFDTFQIFEKCQKWQKLVYQSGLSFLKNTVSIFR